MTVAAVYIDVRAITKRRRRFIVDSRCSRRTAPEALTNRFRRAERSFRAPVTTIRRGFERSGLARIARTLKYH